MYKITIPLLLSAFSFSYAQVTSSNLSIDNLGLQQGIEAPPTLVEAPDVDYDGAYNPFPAEETTASSSTTNTGVNSGSQTINAVESESVAIISSSESNESINEMIEDSADPGLADVNDTAYSPSQEIIDNDLDEQILSVPPLAKAALAGQNNPELIDLLGRYSPTVKYRGIPVKLHNLQKIGQFYSELNYPLAWTKNSRPNLHALQLLAEIRHIDEHAFNPNMYHANSFTGINATTTILHRANFDLLLTDAFITLKTHMTNGIVNPKSQFPLWTQSPKEIDFADTYLRMRNGLSAAQALNVNNPEYNILQKAYARLMANKDRKVTKPIIVPNVAMRFGSTSQAVQILRLRLGVSPGNTYDTELKEAVRQFQINNKLSPDGIAGVRTVAKLNAGNFSDAAKLEKLKINMERARWQNLPQNSPYIWVNIPAFNMSIRQRDRTLFTSNVIVGKSQRKTPIFSDRLEYVVLNPYWNVPKTIFREDKLPVLKRNPNAFKGMQVVSRASGKVISPGAVNWSNGGSGYNLRQRPGPNNPLGRMKFLFPNRHAIYLHDTPKKHLFKKPVRTFSSGCVRVERALDLASFLLDHKGYDENKIKGTWRGSKEKWLNVKHTLGYPVHLSYFTAWADSRGRVNYSADIYKYDASLLHAYDAATKQYL